MTLRVATYVRVPAGVSRPAHRLARQQAHLDAAIRAWSERSNFPSFRDGFLKT